MTANTITEQLTPAGQKIEHSSFAIIVDNEGNSLAHYQEET
jgi:hypothetical protein